MNSLRLRIGTAVLSLLAAALLAAASPEVSRGLSNCTASQLVPALGDVTVNQGLGNYAYRVRGKETLVKFFLTNPTTCAVTSTQSINITGATLSVSTAPALPLLTAFQSFAGAPPVTATVSTNSSADPIFAVPADRLVPGVGDTQFTPTFTATVTYSRKSGTTTTSGLMATLSNSSALFDHKTRALRVLVVPMGDATTGVLASTQYTSTDQSSTQNGFLALSRIFPVPGGISGLAGTGGIRYTINLSAMVNLRAITGAYQTDGKFCGSGLNFDAIKAQLAQFMQSWNSNPLNSAQQVDRVLGVVGEGISDGADNTTFSCADGMASVVSPEAWVRAVADKPSSGRTTPAVPSRTGSLMAMELTHTWGGETNSTHHSTNVTADPTNTLRAYNITTRSYLATNRSVMKYSFTTSPPWDDTLTLLEPADYSYDRCAFGGTAPSDGSCSALGTTTGTTLGVAAGPSFVVSGTVNNETNTADIVQSGFFNSLQLGTDTNSVYRYVRRNARTHELLTNIGFHVSFTNSLHSKDFENDDPGTKGGLFSFALPDDLPGPLSDPAEVQLWKASSSDPGYNPSAPTDVLLYDKIQQPSPPQVLSTTIGAAQQASNYTNTPDTSELHPALTDDASWIAWDQTSSGGSQVIKVAPTDDVSKAVEVPTPLGADAKNPAWNSQRTALAYEYDGDLYTQSIDLSDATPTFGPPVKIYDSTNNVDDVPVPGHHPTWSPNGSEIAFDASGDIYKTSSSPGGTATQLTNNAEEEHDPSWSHMTGDNHIAYVRGPSGCNPCVPPTKLYVLDSANAGTSQTKVNDDGAFPSFGTNGRIAFAKSDGNIWSTKPDGTNVKQISTGGADTFPTAAGEQFAFDRVFTSAGLCGEFCPPPQDDIMLTRITGQQSVTFTASSSAPLKGELDYECNGAAYPVRVGLDPDEVSGAVQTFNVNFDGSNACGGGQLHALVTDGVQHASGSPTPAATPVATKTPTAAIFSPLDTTYPQGATFALSGTGYGADGLVLPASSLHWTLKLPNGNVQDLGNFASKDLKAPLPAGWPVGTLTFSLVATDGSATSDPVTRDVHVVGYDLVGGGFLPPILNPPSINKAKPGAQYPIKWQLKDVSGKYVTDLKTVDGIAYSTDGTPPNCNFSKPIAGPFPLPTGKTVLRYDSTNNYFIYNWTTPSIPGCYVFEVTLAGGDKHQAWFQLS
jgi:hypothetical protein